MQFEILCVIHILVHKTFLKYRKIVPALADLFGKRTLLSYFDAAYHGASMKAPGILYRAFFEKKSVCLSTL
ncbi:hypothetical protein ACFL03_14020 [Thermodesulfobacteriota bacterium]